MTTTDADWLDEAARYFEKRPTGGEDMAFWSNVTNAERCRKIAQSLRSGNGGEVSALADKATALERSLESEGANISRYLRDDIEEAIRAMRTLPVGAETGEPVAAKRLTDKDMRDGMPCDWPACGCDFDAKCSDAPPRSDKANGERPTGHFTIEHDGFSGTVIGHYERLDGKRGVVMQQDGTKVVHVYGEKWLVSQEAGE